MNTAGNVKKVLALVVLVLVLMVEQKKSYDSKPSSHQGGLSQEVPLSKQWIKTYKTSTVKSSETFVNGQQKE